MSRSTLRHTWSLVLFFFSITVSCEWNNIHKECEEYHNVARCCEIVLNKLIDSRTDEAPPGWDPHLYYYERGTFSSSGEGNPDAQQFFWFDCAFDMKPQMRGHTTIEGMLEILPLLQYAETYTKTNQVMPCKSGFFAHTFPGGWDGGCFPPPRTTVESAVQFVKGEVEDLVYAGKAFCQDVQNVITRVSHAASWSSE